MKKKIIPALAAVACCACLSMPMFGCAAQQDNQTKAADNKSVAASETSQSSQKSSGAESAEDIIQSYCSIETCHGADVTDFKGTDEEIEMMVKRMGADISADQRDTLVKYYESLQ